MKTEKLMKPIRLIRRAQLELSIPDKVIVILVTAFLSAVSEMVCSIFQLNTFLFGLLPFALFMFWPNIKKINKIMPKTPEGNAGFGFAFGMIGLVILLIIMILNR